MRCDMLQSETNLDWLIFSVRFVEYIDSNRPSSLLLSEL